MAVRATLTMTVQAGREAEFEEAWRKVADATRLVPGNLRQTLLRSADEPATFVITSDWESREAFGEFERSPEQDALTAAIRALRVSATMRVEEIVAHLDSAG